VSPTGAVEDAIAAAEATEPLGSGRFTIGLSLAGERRGELVLPSDMTSGEWLSLIAYLTAQIAPMMFAAQVAAAAEAAAHPDLVIARPTLVRPS